MNITFNNLCSEKMMMMISLDIHVENNILLLKKKRKRKFATKKRNQKKSFHKI